MTRGTGEDVVPAQRTCYLLGSPTRVAQPPKLRKIDCLQMCIAPDCPSVPTDVQRVAGSLFT